MVNELKASLILNNQSRQSVGKFKGIFYNDGSYDIELEFAKTIMDALASAGNKCSLRLTQFGDMRSFISQGAAPSSYGMSLDIVDYFDC